MQETNYQEYFFENYVALELKVYNLPLYFRKGKNDAEFEFLIKDSNVIVAIDVKIWGDKYVRYTS